MRSLAFLAPLVLFPLIGTLLAPASAAAQEVRGIAVDAGSARPIEGAFVTLLDEADRQVVSTLTGDTGAFALRAFDEGRYRLRVERIGYETWTSEPFAAGPGRTVTRRLGVPVQAVNLAGLQVDVESHCQGGGQRGEQLLRVWDEARKALEVARWTENAGQIDFDLRTWERELDATSLKLQKEKTRRVQREGRVAFLSRPAEELAEEGYVRREENNTYRYYAPDAGVLLSESFRDRHCFVLVPNDRGREGQVGLEFGPVERGRLVDVDGVLWLDEATAELRELDVQYADLDLVGLPRGALASARVEFRRLPTGPWFVRRWWIRMPLLGRYRVRARRQTQSEVRAYAYKEDGGEVVGLRVPRGELLAVAEWGSVVGKVTDGVNGGPLGGAEVRLVGTEHVARTDEAGRFRLEFVPPGHYSLRIEHPDPLLASVPGPEHSLQVQGDEATSVELSYSMSWVAGQVCPKRTDGEAGASRGALLGEVRNAETGRPVSGAVVWVRDVTAAAAADARGQMDGFRADSAGTFLLCKLPAGPLEVQAAAPGLLGEPVRLEVTKGGLALRRLEISPAQAPETVGRGEEGAVEEGTLLRGVVKSAETGEPVSGATVRLVGVDQVAVTGEKGTFVMPGVPRGRHRLVTEHLGSASDTVEVEVFGAERTVRAVFTLGTRPVELPKLEVAVERTFRNPRLAGYYDRMHKGLGDFITKEDLEFHDIVNNFRRIPNVRVDQCRNPANGLREGNCWVVRLQRGNTGGFGRFDSCQPVVYLDGHLLTFFDQGAPDPVSLNPFTVIQTYPRDYLEGIEVYRNPAMAPGQYRTLGDACGIILVWTKGRGSR